MENYIKQRFKDLRKSLNLNQKEFADSIGVTQATVSSIESGKSYPSIELLTKISKIYNIEISYFFGIEQTSTNLDSLREAFIEFRGFLKGVLPNELWQKVEANFPKYKQVV